MAVNLYWENDEHTIARMEFHEQWNWSEAYQATLIGEKMVKSEDHPVHYLLDFRTSKSIPPLALSHARNLLRSRPNNIDMTIFIGATPTLAVFWKTFMQAYGAIFGKSRFAFAKSLEDARQLIAERADSNPALIE